MNINMDIINAIRAVIFLIPGLLLIFFPKNVYKYQVYLIEKLRIKSNIEREVKCYPYIGIIFVIISIILFAFSIIN